MHKNILLLCGLFLLAACGGGSGGGDGSQANIRQPVTNNNAKVTSLNTTVGNRAETITFVESILGETYYVVDANNGGRPSPRSGISRGSSYTSDAYNKYIRRYRNADLKIRDMYDLLSKDREELSQLLQSDTKVAIRLKDSLLLAGIAVPQNATNNNLLDLYLLTKSTSTLGSMISQNETTADNLKNALILVGLTVPEGATDQDLLDLAA
ncbi:MAG: hypothetical protein LBF37_00665, partial [Rickettsiales bacterium]|nr:hypothetical protein [Rickettsiales bacterium]